jgi:hypothetical protein
MGGFFSGTHPIVDLYELKVCGWVGGRPHTPEFYNQGLWPAKGVAMAEVPQMLQLCS